MNQLTLFSDSAIKKTIKTVPITDLSLHPLNPRLDRDNDHINKLAQRISRNGFEITRALWVVQNGSGYKVFAGGTRLEAAQRAGVRSVPVVLHEGLEDADVVRLAYEDNENDEYHAPVSPVDVWASYAALAASGWKNKDIAIAVNVNEGRVSERIRWNSLPKSVKKFFQQELLTEGHLREITSSFNVESFFSPWLTAEAAQLELCKEAAKGLTVRQTADKVKAFKAVIDYAAECCNNLPESHRARFVSLLKENKARTRQQIHAAYSAITARLESEAIARKRELDKQLEAAEAEQLRLEQERQQQAEIEAVLRHIHHGDFRQVCQHLEPESIDAIVTDPPYPEEFIDLYGDLASEAARLLKPGGSLLVMCGQSYFPQIIGRMCHHLNYHWLISYQTPGGQSPQIWPRKINTFWKPVLWFVKGEYQGDWHGDVIKSDVNDNDKRFHHWGQSESGMHQLVTKYTAAGDVILDPFMGGCTTGVVSLASGRRFIGIDNDAEAVKTSKERLFELLSEKE